MFVFPASQIAFWLEGSVLGRLQPRGLGTTLYLAVAGGGGGCTGHGCSASAPQLFLSLGGSSSQFSSWVGSW